MRRNSPILLAAALVVVCGRAQDTPPAPPVTNAPPPAAADATASQSAQTDADRQVNSFGSFVKQLYSVRALTSTLPAALVEQVHDWPDQWGGNHHGFEKRVASLYGQFVIGVGFEDIVKAIHYEDTRYHRLGRGNFFRRTAHAIADTMTARGDDGSRTPAYSLAANAYGSWAIATLWSPRQYRTGVSIAEWGSTGMATFTVTNFAREFWPDLKGLFHHRQAAD